MGVTMNSKMKARYVVSCVDINSVGHVQGRTARSASKPKESPLKV